MTNILIIGGSTPLQKLLPQFLNTEKVKIVAVFLNTSEDQSAMQYCKNNSIEYFASKEICKQLEMLENAEIDWIFNINSTIILSDDILKIPLNGALNLHPGLLPFYAGLHTHQWAIRNKEKAFGVTLHWMEPGIDTGDIAFQKIFPLIGNETGLSLFIKCLNEGVKLVKIALHYIIEGKEIPSIKQDLSQRRLYTNKMAKDGLICWNIKYNVLLDFFRAANYKPFRSPTYEPYSILNGKKFFIEKIQLDNESDRLAPGIIELNKDGKILVGLEDVNIIITPELSKSDFDNMEDFTAYILNSSKSLT